jgi:hypothetical protein
VLKAVPGRLDVEASIDGHARMLVQLPFQNLRDRIRLGNFLPFVSLEPWRRRLSGNVGNVGSLCRR